MIELLTTWIVTIKRCSETDSLKYDPPMKIFKAFYNRGWYTSQVMDKCLCLTRRLLS